MKHCVFTIASAIAFVTAATSPALAAAAGQPAPDFSLTDAHGKPVRLSDYRGIIYAGAVDDRPGASAGETRKAKNYVRTALTAATGGAAGDPANTTPYGCSIKY